MPAKPKSMSRADALDRLPATVGKMAWVSAYSAATAREYARTYRGVTCDALRGARRGRRKRRR